MKYLLLFLLMFSLEAKDYSELQYSLYTNHFSSIGSESFANSVDEKDKKLIQNKVYGFRLVKEDDDVYKSYRFFGGEDSIGSEIYGYAYSRGVTNKTFFLGYVVGGYYYDQSRWSDVYSYRPVGQRSPAYIYKNEQWGIVGILGVELDFKIIDTGSFYIKSSNIFTPYVSNHAISLGWSF